MVDLGLKTLLHDKLRFAITIAGVAFAVTLVLVQVGLFLGILSNASVTIENMDADVWVTSKNTPNVDFAHQFPEAYVERVRSVPGVARADNLIVAFMNMSLPSGAQEATVVYAVDEPRRWNLPWNVAEGDLDDLKRGKVMFMDESAEKRFGPFALGDYREVLGQRLEVVGRTKDARSFTTTPISFMSYDLAQSLQPDSLRGNSTYIVAKLEPGADVEAVRAEIKKRLPFNDVYTKDEWAKKSKSYWIANTGIGFSMYLTVFLGCLVGVVVVAQTLYTSTMEHLREFGTIKAIGGSNADIYRILARQAGVSAVVGFVFGVLPSLAIRPLVARADLKLLIPPEFTLIVFLGTVLMCLLAAMVSFRKVASIDPGLVFRT